MKKVLLSLGLVLSSMTAFAQDDYNLPDGLLAIELQANPFSNDFKTFKMGELKARLFLDNKSVVRFGVGIGIDSDKDENNTSYDDRSSDDTNYTLRSTSTQTKTNKTELKLCAGYEYHFAHADRLDFYAGAEAGYEGKFFSGTSKTSSSNKRVMGTTAASTTSYDEKEYFKMTPGDNPSYNEHSFFANIFTGVDFYVYKGLYIGTELGISFKTGKQKNGYYNQSRSEKVTSGENTTTDWSEKYSGETGVTHYMDNINKTVTTTAGDVTDHSASSTRLKIYVEPAIRLGWLF